MEAPTKPLGTPLILAPVAQSQQFRQAQTQRQRVQSLLAHQVGAYARQIALGQAAQLGIQHISHGQTQDRVAQEFQALVMLDRKAAVRERTAQQVGVLESVLQTQLQLLQAVGHCGRWRSAIS